MTTDTLELTSQALDALKARYADNPGDYALARQFGELNARFIALRKQAEGRLVLGTKLEEPEDAPPSKPHRSGPLLTAREIFDRAPLLVIERERKLPGRNRTMVERMRACPSCEGVTSQGGEASAQATCHVVGEATLKCSCGWTWTMEAE